MRISYKKSVLCLLMLVAISLAPSANRSNALNGDPAIAASTSGSIGLDPVTGSYRHSCVLNSRTWLLGNLEELLLTTDAGESFTQIFKVGSDPKEDMLLAVDCRGESQVLLAAGSSLYRSNDSGSTWLQVTENLPIRVGTVAMVDDQNVLVGGSDYSIYDKHPELGVLYEGSIISSNDGGRTFVKHEIKGRDGLNNRFNRWTIKDFAIRDNGEHYAVGDGLVLVKKGNAPVWKRVDVPAYPFQTVGALGKNLIWTSTSIGDEFVVSFDGGITWKIRKVPQGSPISYTGVLFINEREAIALNGGLLRTQDGGESWTTVDADVRYFHAFLLENGELMVLGHNKVGWRNVSSRDNGLTFEELK
ncbi:MAG: hypothetical protein IPM63_06900 [Acidobacteriota bacterium]|nr:MAG: hypothetical protein IPM63_06900 [Acidobacteriota bacterium]